MNLKTNTYSVNNLKLNSCKNHIALPWNNSKYVCNMMGISPTAWLCISYSEEIPHMITTRYYWKLVN